jgi:hypothetical protein
MSRASTNLIGMIIFVLVGGCESFVYEYDCRGKLANTDGSPATCIPVHMDTQPAKTSSPVVDPWWDSPSDEDMLDMAVTDPKGRFRTTCVGNQYTDWVFIGAPRIPELQDVYVWYKLKDGWRSIRISLTHENQLYGKQTSEQIELRTVTVPAQGSLR